jgi:hypothetical protein
MNGKWEIALRPRLKRLLLVHYAISPSAVYRLPSFVVSFGQFAEAGGGLLGGEVALGLP